MQVKQGWTRWSRVGWGAFLFFSVLSAISAFKFVPAGLIYGVAPALSEGVAAAWNGFVVEGISIGARHVSSHIENVGSTLAVHMIFGGLAVVLIPLQVSQWWRRRKAGQSHRRLGWILLPIVSIAALTTPPISFNMDYPMWSEIGFALGSVAWFVALVLGIYHIRAGNRAAHRRWMIMMAALCFGAVSFRLQLPLGRLFFEAEQIFPYIGWTCWVPNVLVVLAWWSHEARRDGRATRTEPVAPAE